MCKIAKGIVLGLLVICSLSDWKKREISVGLLVMMSVAVIIGGIYDRANLQQKIFGALVGIVLFGVSFCTKEAIGYGDSWIILLLGICEGGMRVLYILFFASLMAGACSLTFFLGKRWKKEKTIPFVPFLTLAYLGVMFL